MDYLSLCLMVKDENTYLPEWIDYHLLVGVEHFYIYDNGSHIPVRDTLAEWIGRGRVTVTDISGAAQQLYAYDHCLRAFGPRSKWIGFIDTDEFIVPKTTTDLRVFLKNYEPYGGLAASWFVFGSNSHSVRPPAGMIASYTLRTLAGLPENRTVKSIVQPARTEIPFSPHHFGFKSPYYCVNERAQRVDFQVAPPCAETIQINHYYIRSREEYAAKLNRGRGDGGIPYNFDRFDYVDQRCQVEDTAILNLIEERTGTPIPVAFEPGANRPVCLHPDLLGLLHEHAAALPPQTAIQPSQSSAQFPLRRDTVIWMRDMDTCYKQAQSENDAANMERLLLDGTRTIPGMVMLYCDLAKLYLNLEKPQAAWDVLAAAWKIAPQSYEVLLGMGLYFLRSGQLERADNTLRMAADQDPFGVNTLMVRAEVLAERGEPNQACALLERAIEAYPFAVSDPKVLVSVKTLGMVVYGQGFVERAERLFDLALQHNPDDTELMVNLAKIYYDRRQFARARTLLEHAARLDPQDTEVRLGLALLKKRSPAIRESQ